MAQKPSIPKGTRDFSPLEMMRRQYIFDKIRDVFRTFGFGPLETPAMENLSTLLGKYGDEGDKLLFKILNSGDYAAGLNDEELRTASRICEKGLRYDLTVPFARYVVQHQSEIAFPFKRYQIQPVWRADRPQKGRYREFYQCDVDVIGTRSLLCEVELIQIVERVFRTLGINVSLKVNNRKILYGIAETIGHADKMIDITVAIDKLEKIGLEAVKAELTERGIGSDAIEKLQPILELTGDNERKLAVLRDVIGSSAVGLEGISEMETIFGYVNRLGVELPIELDFSLARGLNYYTGAIFEVKALDFAIGSICGGGRYDDLTGIFGMPNMSGVGISFGADRIYDVMTGLGLFPADLGWCGPGDVRQSGRSGRACLAETVAGGACRRYSGGDISRKRKDEKTDGVCQSPGNPLRGNRRQPGTGRTGGDDQGYDLRRTDPGAVHPTGRSTPLDN